MGFVLSSLPRKEVIPSPVHAHRQEILEEDSSHFLLSISNEGEY